MKISFLFCVSLICFRSPAQKFTALIDGQMSFPQGEYKKANSSTGLGGRADFFYRPDKYIPLKFGIEPGLQVKGTTSQYFSGYINGFDDDYKVTASSNIFSLSFLTRIQQDKRGKVKPFVDVLAGWNVFYSTVSFERLTFFSNYNPRYSNSSKARWAFAYGAAAGIDIPLNKWDDCGLEIKCAYLIGSKTSYLTNPQIDDSGQVFFSDQHSATDMLIPQVGIRFSIQ